MTTSAVVPAIAIVTSFAFAGLTFGLAYFAVLRQTVDLHAASHGVLAPVLLTVGRLAIAFLLLGAAARVGALPLLSSFMGFLLARALALRGVRGTA
jgi:N-ATPase, AtpR subunit